MIFGRYYAEDSDCNDDDDNDLVYDVDDAHLIIFAFKCAQYK